MLLRALRGQQGAVRRTSGPTCRPSQVLCRSSSSGAPSLIRGIQRDLGSKKRTAVQIATQYLDRIEQAEPYVDSFLTVDREGALQQAAAIDEQIAAGGLDSLGPLAGVPIAVKDNICTKGLPTTAGSKILAGYSPPFDATAVTRLRAAGAVIVGKTNMDEFGMGSSTENSAYKVTRNPWDLDRVPGGSSGGSASAVSAAECVSAVGSDTGGSVRLPAAFCGVVGVKPTYGRVSRYGLVAYASSLDVVGPMAASVTDAALMLSTLAGQDDADATCSKRPVPDFTEGFHDEAALGGTPLAGKRVAWIKECLGEGVDAGVEAAVLAAGEQLRALGATVEEVTLPQFGLGLPAYYVLATSEASSNLSRFDGVRYGERAGAEDLKSMYNATRGAGMGAEVKRRVLMGTYALSAGYYDAYYKQAQKVRTLIREELNAALAQYDCLLSPVCPSVAYKIGEKATDPLSMYKGDLMTVNLNLSGLPGVVLPCGFVEEGGKRLPVGLQMVGAPFQEADLLATAAALEHALAVDTTPPPFDAAP